MALVSSDGDFAPIATGLSEAGIRTLGFGRQDTPAMLRGACTHFLELPHSQPAVQATVPKQKGLPDAWAMLTKIINDEMKDGKVHLPTIAKGLIAAFGGNYKDRFGGKKLSEIVDSLEGFAVGGVGA